MDENRQKKSNFKKILLFAELLIAVIIIFCIYFYFSLDKKLDKTKVELNEEELGITFPTDGYLNIALFGVDSRDSELDDTGTRSDTIMLISINEKTKNINIASVYRDTFVYVPDYGNDNSVTYDDFTKITHSYTRGPARSIATLNQNLDLDISEFVTINFMALVKVIDILGGIEVDVPDKENFVYFVNKYGREVANLNNDSYTELTSSGKQTLTGYQALGYSRVRKGDSTHSLSGESDFTRTERQRKVLDKTLDKVKSNGITEFNSILNAITDNMRTSFSTAELLSLAASLKSYDISASIGFPYETKTVTTNSGSSELATPSLQDNVTQLHQELFPDISYTPSQTLISSSDYISQKYLN